MKSKISKKRRKFAAVTTEIQQVPVVTRSKVLEAVVHNNNSFYSVLKTHFNLSITSFPSPDLSLSPEERKLSFINYVLELYGKHIDHLTRRSYQANNLGEEAHLTEEEKQQFILNMPEILNDINATLKKLVEQSPNHNIVYLTEPMSRVITKMIRYFNSCITTSKVALEYLGIIDSVIKFYELHGNIAVCVKFHSPSLGAGYVVRKDYSFTSACVLYNTYLNVYQILKDQKIPTLPLPSEKEFLTHAKKFKGIQLEYMKEEHMKLGDKKLEFRGAFVPNRDFSSGYFSLHQYYVALVNFYANDDKKFVHYLRKMMDSKEDFNIVTASRSIFEKIDMVIASDKDLQHHLLFLSLGLKVIDNHFNYYQLLDEKSRKQIQLSWKWTLQATKESELNESNLLEIREKYYYRYVKTVSEIATGQGSSLDRLAKEIKLDDFLGKSAVHVFCRKEDFDVHNVYAELELVVKERQFAPIIMKQLKRINVPCHFDGKLTISIEASLLEIHDELLHSAFLKARDLCRADQRKRLEQLKREERDRKFAEERLEKERLEKERLEKERLEKERLEKERFEKERQRVKAIIAEEQKGKEKKEEVTSSQNKAKTGVKDQKVELIQIGSFFNPRQSSSTKPVFKLRPEGVRIHKLRPAGPRTHHLSNPDVNGSCKYWACIHPCLADQMIRENKTPQLNRLSSQLSEGSLGKGHGVRGIIQGDTIKWDDPSMDCRYYGLVTEEYKDSLGKHILFMFTTKVDTHSKKTPNIIVPPELKEKKSTSLKM